MDLKHVCMYLPYGITVTHVPTGTTGILTGCRKTPTGALVTIDRLGVLFQCDDLSEIRPMLKPMTAAGVSIAALQDALAGHLDVFGLIKEGKATNADLF